MVEGSAIAALARFAGKVVSGLIDAAAKAVVDGVRWLVRSFFGGSIVGMIAIAIGVVVGVQFIGGVLGADAAVLTGFLGPLLVIAFVVRIMLLLVRGR